MGAGFHGLLAFWVGGAGGFQIAPVVGVSICITMQNVTALGILMKNVNDLDVGMQNVNELDVGMDLTECS